MYTVSGINESETIAMENPQAKAERKNKAAVRSSIFLRIFAFLLLTVTSAALFAMPYLAG